MWLEYDVVNLGEAGRYLRVYEVREYDLDWRMGRWQKP